jgi:hypothetical protein
MLQYIVNIDKIGLKTVNMKHSEIGFRIRSRCNFLIILSNVRVLY